MEYAGGRAEASLDLRNYQDSDYEEYRIMYNGCFLAMRTALELQPAECCAGREEAAAVRLAQQRAGLLVTGTVDRGTWAALLAQSCPHCSKEE